MCTKHHVNGFISGTSKRVKFVENVFCSQKYKHILCGNILIVCWYVFQVLLTYLTDLLQLYILSRSLRSSAHSRISSTHEKCKGQCIFLCWLCHLKQSVIFCLPCLDWRVPNTVKAYLFSICFQRCLNLSSLVCVDRCAVDDFLSGFDKENCLKSACIKIL